MVGILLGMAWAFIGIVVLLFGLMPLIGIILMVFASEEEVDEEEQESASTGPELPRTVNRARGNPPRATLPDSSVRELSSKYGE